MEIITKAMILYFYDTHVYLRFYYVMLMYCLV